MFWACVGCKGYLLEDEGRTLIKAKRAGTPTRFCGFQPEICPRTNAL
ncbi:MAG TPA: hypothetical protein VFY54_02625 [Rubrobacter sp.]|nr:hypothetical protein [Rubrobacter sp.]